MNTQTICIIGASGTQGSKLTRALALHTSHRLLLMSGNKKSLDILVEDIRKTKSDAQLEMIDCMVDGCWEADIIVMDLSPEMILAKMENLAAVVNRKTIIHFSQPVLDGIVHTGNERQPLYEWEKWFPHSGLVRVYLGSLASLIESNCMDAEQLVMDIFSEAGLNPIAADKGKNLTTKHTQSIL